MDQDKRNTGPETRPGRRLARRVAGLALRTALWILVAAAAVSLVLALVLALPAGRQFLLRQGLDLAGRSLPGTLLIERAAWPRVGTFDIEGLLWTDGPDTLARVEILRLDIHLGDLWRRDLTVLLAEARGVAVDMPAIRSRMPAEEAAAPGQDDTGDGTGWALLFIRPGGLAPLPSVAVRRMTLARISLTTTEHHTARLDSLDLSFDLRHGRPPHLAAGFRARPLPTLGVSWRLQGQIEADTLDLHLAPLYLAAPSRLPSETDLRLSGRLRLALSALDEILAGRNPVWPTLRIDRLQIDGDAGSWRLDARLDPDTSGMIALQSEMPRAPVALLEGLASLTEHSPFTADALDTLAARWATHGPPGIDLRIDLRPYQPPAPITAAQATARGRLRLPAPAAAAPLLPPQLIVDDLGPIELDLQVDYDGSHRPPSLSATFDLTRTAWLDSARLHLSGTLEKLDRVNLVLRLPGLTNDLADLDLAFTGAVSDSLRRINGVIELSAHAPPSALALAGDIELLNLMTAPAAIFTGHRLTVSFDHRTLTAAEPWHASYTSADTTTRITGLRLSGPLGRVELDGHHRPDSLTAAMDLDLLLPLEAVRPLLSPEHQAHLVAGTLSARGRMAATGAPSAPWTTADLRLAIEDNEDLADFTADLALSLGGAGRVPSHAPPGRLGWQPGLALFECRLDDRTATVAEVSARVPWPMEPGARDSLDLQLSASSLDLARLSFLLPPGHAITGDATVEARARGLLPSWREDLDLVRDLDLELAGTVALNDLALKLADGTLLGLSGTIDIAGTSADPLASATLALTGDLGSMDLQARAGRDRLSVLADLALELDSEVVRPYLPAEHQILLPRGALSATGRVTGAGPPAAPWVHGRLRLAVVDQPDLAALTTAIELQLGGHGDVPEHLAQTATPAASWRARSARLSLRLLEAQQELLRLDALAPLPHLTATADSVDLRLNAPALDLARLAPLLPSGTTLAGRLDARTRLSGIAQPGQIDPDLDLDGRLQISGLRLQLPEGSRLALSGRADLSGTSLAPQVRGGLKIEGGLIRLPDPPPALLATSGEALLWQATATTEAMARALPDSSPLPEQPVASAQMDTVATGPTLLRILPDLVLTLTSPGGLWLRGQGLDVELAGDLSLLLHGDRIAVEGELHAIQGTMRQLGHLFRLDRGQVVFDGSETELNPELDLSLSVRVGSHRIRIMLNGTAAVPILRLISEPEMSEGDILAILLFGKPLDELDEGQTGLLVSRTAQIAMAYGTARLQESLARQLHLDMVSIAPREGDEETTALTVGKYLSPRVMVRYEQLLRKGSAFFVHLDYAFAGALRLHTQISQGEESGVQLKWQQDW